MMIDVLIVSDYSPVRELFRSALRVESKVSNVYFSSLSGAKSHYRNSFSGHLYSIPDVVIYDLDSIKNSPVQQLERMEEFMSLNSLSKHGAASLIIVASEAQLVKLNTRVSFLDSYLITKPFTFRQVVQIVSNVWTSNVIPRSS